MSFDMINRYQRADKQDFISEFHRLLTNFDNYPHGSCGNFWYIDDHTDHAAKENAEKFYGFRQAATRLGIEPNEALKDFVGTRDLDQMIVMFIVFSRGDNRRLTNLTDFWYAQYRLSNLGSSQRRTLDRALKAISYHMAEIANLEGD